MTTAPHLKARALTLAVMALATAVVACAPAPTTPGETGEGTNKTPTVKRTPKPKPVATGTASPDPTVASPSGGATATPTPNASATSSVSATTSPTPTPATTSTPTPTPTVSPTPTPAPTTTPVPTPTPPSLYTLAGKATPGNDDGVGAAASFNGPTSLGIHGVTGHLIVADTGNNVIRQIELPGGNVTTIAGSGGVGATDHSIAMNATFNRPQGIFCANDGTIYVADTGNHRIRRLTYTAGTYSVSTLAGSTSGFNDAAGTSAQFKDPRALTLDLVAKRLYVADAGNHRIRTVDVDPDHSFAVTTLAGDDTPGTGNGSGTAARFITPTGIIYDGFGLFVIDQGDGRIRQIQPGTGTAESATVDDYTATGTPGYMDGSQGQGAFDFGPAGGALFSALNGNMFIAESGNQRIRLYTSTLGVKTLAGAGDRPSSIESVPGSFKDGPLVVGNVEDRGHFNGPLGVAFKSVGTGGTIYVADTLNNRIRYFQLETLPNPFAP